MAEPKNMSDEEKMAAEWASMESGGDAGGAGAGDGTARVLNQDEIDSLLGFSMDEENAPKKSGVRALINSALVSYERLPML